MLGSIPEAERRAAMILLGVLALAAFLRFFMLSEIGIRGDDTLYYLSLARGWAEPVREDYRLVIRAIYALALRMGDSDWSIKALNAGLDVLSVLLLYGIARRLSGRLVSLATALSYALMPRAIAF
jgi:4-amino-4-deoxy-L-arabinose transferase-like glycosyltransferase